MIPVFLEEARPADFIVNTLERQRNAENKRRFFIAVVAAAAAACSLVLIVSMQSIRFIILINLKIVN